MCDCFAQPFSFGPLVEIGCCGTQTARKMLRLEMSALFVICELEGILIPGLLRLEMEAETCTLDRSWAGSVVETGATGFAATAVDETAGASC